MSERRGYLDVGIGETRAVVTLDGRPERLLIARDGDLPSQAVGAQVVARVRKLDRALAIAFLDLGEGPDAVLNLSSPRCRLSRRPGPGRGDQRGGPRVGGAQARPDR